MLLPPLLFEATTKVRGLLARVFSLGPIAEAVLRNLGRCRGLLPVDEVGPACVYPQTGWLVHLPKQTAEPTFRRGFWLYESPERELTRFRR